MANLLIKNLTKSYREIKALDALNIEIESGQYVVLVGPSGCGKTTLLRTIAGLESHDVGEIYIGGKRIDQSGPANREVAMVFQSYALYPHMNVYENIAFGAERKADSKLELKGEIDRVVKSLQLDRFLERKPGQLSGGQRQRVGIARAMVRKPKIFLLDEPLSNLDANLRLSTRYELLQMHARLDATILHVTHDQNEAMTLADQIIVMNNGKIEQIATPSNLYKAPANIFVAKFIGNPGMNIISGDLAKKMGAYKIGVRPEHIVVSDSSEFVEMKVEMIEYLGNETHLHLVKNGLEKIVMKTNGFSTKKRGDTLCISIVEEHVCRFAENGELIG